LTALHLYSNIKGMDYKDSYIGQKMSGFASPSQGYEEQGIDLNRLILKNLASTYCFRLETAEMEDLGLPKGALLVVDRSIAPYNNAFGIIKHENNFLCRQIIKYNGNICFKNGNEIIYPIVNETEIIGIVTACIQEF